MQAKQSLWDVFILEDHFNMSNILMYTATRYTWVPLVPVRIQFLSRHFKTPIVVFADVLSQSLLKKEKREREVFSVMS